MAYVIYIAQPSVNAHGWTARAYRDLEDGEHVGSSEGADTLDLALREVGRAINDDVSASLASPRTQAKEDD